MKKLILIVNVLFLAFSQIAFAQDANDLVDSAMDKGIFQRDYEGAIAYCTRAIALNPKFEEAFIDRAIAKSHMGRFADAITDLDQALLLSPNNDNVYLQLCYAYLNLGGTKANYLKAIEEFDRSMQLGGYSIYHSMDSPYRDWAVVEMDKMEGPHKHSQFDQASSSAQTSNEWLDKGDEKVKIMDFLGALTDYDQAILFNPENIRAYNSRGWAKVALQRFDDAVEDLDMAINMDPKYTTAYINRGNAKANSEYYIEAIKDYDKAIALNAKLISVYDLRGETKIELGRYADAIRDCDKAIALDPKYIATYSTRGYAYYKLGGTKQNYQKAIADYDTCVHLGGREYLHGKYNYRDDAVAAMEGHLNNLTAKDWLNIGVEKIAMKDNKGAIIDFDQAIALDPGLAPAYIDRGIAKNFLGQNEDAISDFDNGIALDPNSHEAFTNRGFAKINLGRYTEAIVDCDKAIALEATDFAAYNFRGYAYYKLGGSKANFKKAVEDYDMAFQIDKDGANLYFQYRDDAVASIVNASGQ